MISGTLAGTCTAVCRGIRGLLRRWELVLTETSAGKLSSPYTNDGRTMSDAAYELKGNAAAHIDELAQTSRAESLL